MQTILQSNLKPNRYAHCLGVMDTAIILAITYFNACPTRHCYC